VLDIMLTQKAYSSCSVSGCSQGSYTGEKSKEFFFPEISFSSIIFKNGANIIKKRYFET